MKLKPSIAGIALLFGSGFAVGNSATSAGEYRTVASDLYARNLSGFVCTRLVTSSFCPDFSFQTGWSIGLTKIVSAGGASYSIWDNPFCNVGNGSQVSFDP